ncbi:MAG: 3,4-dihydroxy-2-butanone-4-phosphate synthase [Planctomycetes bacterium]|nr:3,4-dihydroxy-2-butanone-4-phosphate synthase [Planctomycetota bacterium]
MPTLWPMALSPIPEILQELRAGRIIVLVDDEKRENEGDFVCAAEKVTPEIINFMTRVGAGYLCVPLTGDHCDRLNLVPQASSNSSLWGTPLTVTIDGHPRHGVSTGVSTFDRAKTIELMIDPKSTIDDFVRPGHINPLRARDGGVLVRTGQTEGAVDLAKLAGMHPSAVLIEVVREDGNMARMNDLDEICKKHNLKMCSVDQIIEHRLAVERLVERIDPVNGTMIDTPYGQFNLIAYQSAIDPLPHIVLTVGGVGDYAGNGSAKSIDEPVLVRVHRRDLLGDIFDEVTNPTGKQLRASLRMIQKAGRGALVYLRPEGSGDALHQRLLRINRPEKDNINAPDLTRTDGVAARAQPMDLRVVGIGSQILLDLGLRKIKVLTNHPRKWVGLPGFGLDVVEQVAISMDE